jgi:hypothetical protein
MYLTIGHAIAYGLALLATGFLLGILAKPFKDQVRRTTDDYIDWSKITDGYDWIAQDSWDEGTTLIRGYKVEPKINERDPPDWNGGEWESFRDAVIGPIPPWRESRRRRPK